MQTIIEQWRVAHREELESFYTLLQSQIFGSDTKITSEVIEKATSLLGITSKQTERSESGRTVIFDLADGKIDFSIEDVGRNHQAAQIADWMNQIQKPAKWERFREVDAHVIHMHMKHLHGEQLPEMIRKAGVSGLIPWHIDALETDSLSIHLLSERCKMVDDDLELREEAKEDERAEFINEAISRVGNAGLTWSKLPGSVRRGITITGNHQSETVTIDGDKVRIKLEHLPETLKEENVYIGRPLHEIVDIKGYRDENMRIKGMSRRSIDSSMTFLVNRHGKDVRRRIERTI